MTRVLWNVAPDGKGGYKGEVTLLIDHNGSRAALITKGTSKSKAAALMSASAKADRLLDDPILQAIMPPQAAIAVKAIKVLSKGAAAGKLREVASKFSGPGVKRLASALKGLF